MAKRTSLFLFLIIFLFTVPLFSEEIETGLISGEIMIKDGGPMSNGMVVFFRADEGPVPDPNKYLRIPDEIADLDDKGKFRMPLTVGRYYLGAIKRMSGELIGPPQDGDYFFISRDSDGTPLAYSIKKNRDLNVGTLSEAVPFKRTIAEGVSGISGTIRDLKGDSVKGAIVFAYFTKTMTGLPPFASYRTGEDGKYFISVAKGGRYYLRVRDIYGGGPPVPGAVMGGYGEKEPAPVTVRTGKTTKDIDITVIRHLERGPKAQERFIGIDKDIQELQKKKKTKKRLKK